MKKAIIALFVIFISISWNKQKKETFQEKCDRISLQNLKNSLKEESELIKKEPNDCLNYSIRASTEYRLGLYQSALKDINKAIELDPERKEFYCGRAQCNIKLNRLETVCDDIQKSGVDYYIADEVPGELREKYCK